MFFFDWSSQRANRQVFYLEERIEKKTTPAIITLRFSQILKKMSSILIIKSIRENNELFLIEIIKLFERN